MMKSLTLALLLVSVFMLTGCNLDALFGGGPDQHTEVSGTGAIVFVELEGGFYGLETDSGRRFLPLNLADEFRQDGLRVTFTAWIADDVVTIHQWGTPINVVQMARL